DVTSVGIMHKGVRLDFVREGERWLVAEKGDYPAAGDKVRRIALALADMTLIEPKTQEPKLYPRLDVEDPGRGQSALVTVKDRSGATLAALIVGKRRYDRLGQGIDGVYVRRPGHRQSWLAAGSLDLDGDAANWLQRAVLDIPAERIAKVTLTQPDGKTLVIDRAKPNGKFAVEGAPAGTKFANDTTISEPAIALASLTLDDVAPAAQNPIPETGVVRARYQTFDGLEIDLRLVERGKTPWVAITATGSGKEATAAKTIAHRTAPWIYAIPNYKADLLKTTLGRLVLPAKS
ncbi:MAG TPA: DUF4340 domain-containing protein, partial [Stellaceae bacterium]|nr:DUF4340 domain-containing protein [Stellaceae bacterium]